jgi:hypothetical protein
MTITHRPRLIPDFTFEEWCKRNNIPKPPGGDVAMLVMGTSGFTTRRSAGKQKANQKKVMEYNKTYEQYLEDLTYSKIMVPLDLNKEADRAYLRVIEKRSKNET